MLRAYPVRVLGYSRQWGAHAARRSSYARPKPLQSRRTSPLFAMSGRVNSFHAPLANHQSLLSYTAGRWLHLDKLQRQGRCIEFNFDRLYGGFSRAFIIKTDDGKEVVAKFPTSVAGPVWSVTNSEVATITYLQRNTQIPIPAILDWSDDLTNPIGSAYIIMEHAGGLSMQEIWPKMTFEQEMKCIGSISTRITEASKLDFPGYGSIYFTDAAFLDAGLTQPLDDSQYCIGPHCGVKYWDCNVGEPRYYAFKEPNRGPCQSFSHQNISFSPYASALINVGLARLPPDNAPIPCQQPSYQGSVNEHKALLDLGQSLFPTLIQHPQIQSNATPTLFHPALHKRNVFVSEDDPTIVTGFIDWQSTCIEPAFCYADGVPDFAKPPPEETSEVTEEGLCSKAFEAGLAILSPRLGSAGNIDETFLRPFRYCHRTWRDGVVPFTHELLQLRERWQDLGFQEDCPIPALSSEDMRVCQERLDICDKMWEVRQDIVETLGVEQDGWAPEDRWEEVKEAHLHTYELIMAGLESEKDREDIKIMWPFDGVEQ